MEATVSSVWLSAAVSAAHILGVALGFGSIVARARALGRGDIPAALGADNLWGLSALVLLGTGLARAFSTLEKGSGYYLASPAFHLKLGLFGLVLALEVWPMITLLRWRLRPELREVGRAATLARVSWLELALLLIVPFVAAAMARGLGF
jgi:putative membrane protein